MEKDQLRKLPAPRGRVDFDEAKAVKMPTAGINADLHGSAEYRAAMISVIASRAVAAALAR